MEQIITEKFIHVRFFALQFSILQHFINGAFTNI